MTYQELGQLKNLSLEEKIKLSEQIIKEVYKENKGNVNVSFSGGKDSTVVLHLIRSLYPEVKAVFFNTTNEHKEIIRFVKETENVIWLKPRKSFSQILKTEGYPLVSKEISELQKRIMKQFRDNKYLKSVYHMSFLGEDKYKFPNKWLWLLDEEVAKYYFNPPKEVIKKENWYKVLKEKEQYYFDVIIKRRKKLGLKTNDRIVLTNYCCNVLKKNPFKIYQNKTKEISFIGLMAEESNLRLQSILKKGYKHDYKVYPIYFWTEKDIWDYINKYNVKVSKAYETEKRTGCIMCGFGLQYDKTRIERVCNIQPKRVKSLLNIKNQYSTLTFGEAIEKVLLSLENN